MKQLTRVCACLLWISCGLAAQSNPVPFINQPLVPASAAPGSGAFTLTVNGSGFAPTAVLSWNESFRPTTVLSKTRLQAQIMASDIANPGTARVRVVNLDSHNETSDVAYFPTRTPSPGVAFAQDPNFSTPGVPGDFNNDGKLDLVNVYALNSTTLETDVYLSKGNAQFQNPIKTQFTGYAQVGVGQIIIGDFNGDHNLDLFVVLSQGKDSEASTFFGDGAGRFTLGTSPTGDNLTTFMSPAVDIDGDGNLDLVATQGVSYNPRRGSILVYFGGGNGAFTPGHSIAGEDLGPAVVGDFNEDGKLDLAFLAASGNLIKVAINSGKRTFAPAKKYQISPARDLVAADVDGDGHLDLITDRGAVLLGAGNGSFTIGPTGGNTSGSRIFTGDFNGDGKLDLAVDMFPGLSVLMGNGDATFQPPINTAYYAGDVVGLGDYNHDGRLDLVGYGEYFWQVPANLYPGLLDFGQQAVGTKNLAQTATLTNANSEPLSGIQIKLAGTDTSDFSQENNCPATLPVDGSCQIQVTFAPMSVGDKSASLTVLYSGLGSPQSVTLSGIGVAATSVSLTPSTLTFPTQNLKTSSAPQTATLTNTGSTDVIVSAISATVPFHQTNNCPSTLPMGHSCQIKIQFRPTTIGQANGTLSVTDNAPDSPQTVGLSGQGTLITLSPIGINFGSQKVGTSSSPVPVTLSNQGATTLNISQITIGGADPSDFSQTNTCGGSLAAGTQCTIQVTFTPTLTGTRSASVQVQDDVNPSPQTVSLNGTGT